MLIPRSITSAIIKKLDSSKKGIVIYGARQVGKTTLVNEIIQKLNFKTLTVNGDQSQFLDILSSRDLNKIKSLVEGYELLFIDEAQRIPEIGLTLKIILDNLPFMKVIVTGSSSLDLASKISEPLTGRVWTYHLYPISFLELSKRGFDWLDNLNSLNCSIKRTIVVVYFFYLSWFTYRLGLDCNKGVSK